MKTDETREPPAAAVVLAAGSRQVPLIRKARELGLAVLGVDVNPRSPGFEFCAERIVRSTYDAEGIWAELSAMLPRYRVTGLLCNTGRLALRTAVVLAGRLGVPSISLEAAESTGCLYKERMLARLAAAGVPVPEYGMAADQAAGRELLSRLGLPLVVKPSIAWGHFGISLVERAEDFPAALERALEAPRVQEMGWAPQGAPAIVQRYVEGAPFVMNYLCQRAGARFVASVDRRIPLPRHSMVETEYVCPSQLPDQTLEAADRAARLAIRAVGIDVGPARVEFVARGRGPEVFIMEIDAHIESARGMYDWVFPRALGLDYLAEYVLTMTGRGRAFQPRRLGVGISRFPVDEEDLRTGRLREKGRLPPRPLLGVGADYARAEAALAPDGGPA